MSESNKIVVSIRLMTYNHGRYIKEAMDSIMAQKTNFVFEIVVGDDFSTDKTLEIIRTYFDTDNIRIKILERKKGDKYWQKRQKLGRLYNFTNIIENCSGKYIALLDGDDYWTDPYKLQKQVDVLEAHPECIASHHWQKITQKNKEGKFIEEDAKKNGHKDNTGYYDGYYPVQIATVGDIFSLKLRPKIRTLLFRNIFKEIPFPDWFYKIKFGDEPLNFILGRYGKFYFIDEEMAVYRIASQGFSKIFNSKKGYIDGNKAWIKAWAYVLNYHNNKYIPQATIGMKLFLKRTLVYIPGSLVIKAQMLWFIANLDVMWSIKKELMSFCFQKHQVYSKPHRIQ